MNSIQTVNPECYCNTKIGVNFCSCMDTDLVLTYTDLVLSDVVVWTPKLCKSTLLKVFLHRFRVRARAPGLV